MAVVENSTQTEQAKPFFDKQKKVGVVCALALLIIIPGGLCLAAHLHPQAMAFMGPLTLAPTWVGVVWITLPTASCLFAITWIVKRNTPVLPQPPKEIEDFPPLPHESVKLDEIPLPESARGLYPRAQDELEPKVFKQFEGKLVDVPENGECLFAASLVDSAPSRLTKKEVRARRQDVVDYMRTTPKHNRQFVMNIARALVDYIGDELTSNRGEIASCPFSGQDPEPLEKKNKELEAAQAIAFPIARNGEWDSSLEIPFSDYCDLMAEIPKDRDPRHGGVLEAYVIAQLQGTLVRIFHRDGDDFTLAESLSSSHSKGRVDLVLRGKHYQRLFLTAESA